MRAGVERITKMEVELKLEEKQLDAREHAVGNNGSNSIDIPNCIKTGK